jgi:hypothetical protein
MTGASILAANGREGLAVAMGGPDDWAEGPGRRLETAQ